jgi:arsenite methyltransferase
MQYLKDIDREAPGFADLYDELPLWSARFGLMLLEQVRLRPGMTILDVGAGTGFMTLELAQRCGAASTVIAVDPWAAAMGRLARKVHYLGIQNVRAIAQDIATLDLPEGSVDLIVSNLGINNFDNPGAALRSCFRAAKPGAGLLLTTNLVGHWREFYAVYREVLVEIGHAGQIPALDAHVNHRATVDSARAMLEQAGFQFVRATTHSFPEQYVDGSALLRHYFVRLGFVPAWKSIAPEGAVETTFAALEQRLNTIAAERGGLALTVPAACIEARKPDAA